jgi:hypothetical protein
MNFHFFYIPASILPISFRCPFFPFLSFSIFSSNYPPRSMAKSISKKKCNITFYCIFHCTHFFPFFPLFFESPVIMTNHFSKKRMHQKYSKLILKLFFTFSILYFFPIIFSPFFHLFQVIFFAFQSFSGYFLCIYHDVSPPGSMAKSSFKKEASISSPSPFFNYFLRFFFFAFQLFLRLFPFAFQMFSVYFHLP